MFLPLVLIIYFLLPARLKNIFLLFANLVFYAWGEGAFVLVMVICVVANYVFGVLIENEKARPAENNRKKLYITIAVLFNVGLLGFYKYTNFLVDNFNQIIGLASIEGFKVSKVHLPIGISFFTFQALSYVIDVYRNDVKGAKSFLDFAVYKSLFPQLIAGPIVRYKDVATQLAKRFVNREKFAYGVRRFIIGLGKKVLIANTVALATDQIFSIPGAQLTTGISWIGVFCFWLQIYFDFSGYSDMAIGLGHMLGFTFKENFNYPNISRSVREYWERWHISLTSWIRDYVYFPLGGNRISEARTYFNLLAIFFITGIWHGASWTYVIWGLYNGLFMILERNFINIERLRFSILRWLYMFLALIPGYAMFRSDTISYAITYIKAMYGFAQGTGAGHHVYFYVQLDTLLAMILGFIGSAPIFPYVEKKINEFTGKPGRLNAIVGSSYPTVRLLLLLFVFALSIIKLSAGSYNPFIYFRF
jgi:alginate O-acetyltransferase complex protein AlgI